MPAQPSIPQPPPLPVRLVNAIRAWLTLLLLLALAGTGAAACYAYAHSRLAAAIYAQRLAQLGDDYAQLQSAFNEAVERTAVTELAVTATTLSVAVRRLDGQTRLIATPYDPNGEIYVDFVVRDGRLWIRRVFDAATAPQHATVVDPDFAQVDWQDQASQYGKAVYRSLSPGRWIVTVNGSGALALTPLDDTTSPAQLSAAPPIRDYGPVVNDARAAVQAIGLTDVLKHLATLHAPCATR